MARKSVILSLLAASGLSVLLAGCGRNGKLATGSEGPSPRITFEKVAYDFGEVGVNAKRTDEIPFSNTGQALLKITNVEGCCGITNVKLDKTEFAPGETGTLKMEWTAKPNPATMMWQLVVHSNDGANPALVLNMRATLVQRITWEPRRLKLFLNEENAGCPKLTVRSLDNQPFAIQGFKSTADCVTADYDRAAEATQFVLEPKVDMKKLEENLQGRISLELSHPEGREVSILFDVLPKYTINPQLLIVLRAEPGKPTTRKIKVLCNYGQASEVESVTSKSRTMAVRMLGQKEIPDGCELEVEITPLAPPVEGKTIYTDTFSLNLKGGEELPITCNAYYTPAKPEAPVGSEAK
ncbi:MAG: hypothetical protein A2Z25_00865 [Planctomycetes bacterium RBG_16_55_9]|nr:MAG: hypothetical protein A2Z25_00865 [Planctomycetes bacterium RBG_16_55_9]